MKKGKYIDHYVVMACLSKIKASATQSVDELIATALCKKSEQVSMEKSLC